MTNELLAVILTVVLLAATMGEWAARRRHRELVELVNLLATFIGEQKE